MISVVGYGVVCNYLSSDLSGNFPGEAWAAGTPYGDGVGATCGSGPSPSGSYLFAYDTSGYGADTSLAEQICGDANSVWFNY